MVHFAIYFGFKAKIVHLSSEFRLGDPQAQDLDPGKSQDPHGTEGRGLEV